MKRDIVKRRESDERSLVKLPAPAYPAIGGTGHAPVKMEDEFVRKKFYWQNRLF
jgi:hypothetical protein